MLASAVVGADYRGCASIEETFTLLSRPTPHRLERFAMILGCTASWGNERVLVGPEKEDRRGQGTGHAHRRSRPLLRRGHLHRQALRSRGPQREAARSEEAPRLQAEAGRRSKQAPGSGSRRASGGHPLPKARVLAESGRGFGQ